jgi:Fe-S oxidoreductase
MALEAFLAESERCSQCSYCKWIPFDQVKSWRFAKNCPSIAYNNFNSYSARGRYSISRSLLKKQSGYSEKLRHIVFTCLTCGSCDVSCKVCRYNLEPLEMARELKFRLVEEGQGLEAHEKIVSGLNRKQNTMQQPRSKRGAWAEGLDVKRAPSQQCEVLFHAGCRFSYDRALWASVRGAVTLLRSAGVDLGIMAEKEMCCGGRVYSMGYREPLERLARAHTSFWRKRGVKTVVTSCADCYHAFKRLFARIDSGVEVLHTAELLHQLFRAGKIGFRSRVPLTVTYHDPCHLGRQGEAHVPWQGVETKIKNQIIVHQPRKPRYNGARGIYDPPREILGAIPGLKLVEMERIREYAWCCGAGGGVREAYPEYSAWTAGERIEEARATGADALVSACPWCERNLTDAAAAAGSSMMVYDIADLVLRAVQGERGQGK